MIIGAVILFLIALLFFVLMCVFGFDFMFLIAIGGSVFAGIKLLIEADVFVGFGGSKGNENNVQEIKSGNGQSINSVNNRYSSNDKEREDVYFNQSARERVDSLKTMELNTENEFLKQFVNAKILKNCQNIKNDIKTMYEALDKENCEDVFEAFKNNNLISEESKSYLIRNKEINVNVKLTRDLVEKMFERTPNIQRVVIPRGFTSIEKEAFMQRNIDMQRNIESVIIPDSVKIIGEGAFCLCKNLKKITIGSNVEEIRENAFWYCQQLETIKIPKSVKKVQREAFGECSRLKNVRIESGVEFIGEAAFSHCYSLQSIRIPYSVKRIDFHAFFACDSDLTIYCEVGSKPNDWSKYWNGGYNVVWGCPSFPNNTEYD